MTLEQSLVLRIRYVDWSGSTGDLELLDFDVVSDIALLKNTVIPRMSILRIQKQFLAEVTLPML